MRTFAASGRAQSGQLVADEIVDAVTRASAVLQEEQLEAPLSEALGLVPEDDDGALDSNGTARVGGGHRGVTEIVRSLEGTGAAARTPELADNGGLVTSGRNGVINVGIKNTLY